ncbi:MULTISPECIES: ABC transporter ATP-binding protein [Brevibacillus]|jgi:ABC-type multidrug transport system, ATPase and permease components|uniref:Multidrug ABC transporter ATP-binding protein n=1 Tax=Brevibacillus parabrevis TaxID=54914 RepID=A0A4Y3PTF5_BREPA|nr:MULTISPECIES: ABC transporter ATP-binding protein [Brevibacillus]MBU8714641.1 ABC transporter ATP-binding protein/permease [Brevibacillus parabrevis]MDH6353193.1 ATP-binding cassette subfamily B protein [Brevibacillus sp. 1238]MDR5002014.1 ABC transporter ATP-binding protein [Brevibacillus parabrevis]MED2254643.1 ABC transporter ATP-binding protein [Brevibacillus parabrevis]NRQ57102.1 ABC transporter ATP-binding protein [Brevibacillus sp. HD1.4A]
MLRRFFAYYKPYMGLFIADFSCAILAALLELAFPLAVNRVVDDLLPSGNWLLILYACLGLLGIYVVSAALHYVVTYYGHKLGINIESDMRKKLFDRVQKLSFRFFDNNKTGHLVSRMTNDLMDIGEIAHHGPEDLFIAVMTLLGAFGIMLSINWQLAVLTFIIVPLMIYLSMYFSRKMSRAFDRMFADVADYNARVENNISGIRVVQAFANEKHEIARFAENNGRFRLTKLLTYRIMAWNSSLSFILMKLVSLFVLVCGTYYVIQGKMTYGEFIAFVMLSNVFLNPIQQINNVIETFPKGVAGFKRYLELLETEPDVDDAPDAKPVSNLRGDIRFENVTFGYENKEKVLQGLSLSIRAGETVALVGPSGAGKTTLCSLLPRFYDVDSGSIMIDGIDIRSMTLESLRSHIGIVQQDVFLFDGSIRENIAYGKLGATDEELWDAARRAQLEDVIRALPEGLDTLIGERGVKLSGGQKQRLSIARMFLKNPPILILDEATSALDTETEAAIQQALAELSHGRTTLVIAHRLATIKNADRIIVVAEQGIAEQGHHDELLQTQGVYSRLHQAQFSS